MSVTADQFIYPRPFPFCVYSITAADLDLSQLEDRYFPITGLDYDDAFLLYWNTESIEVSFNITGEFTGSVTIDYINVTSITVSADTNNYPSKRVCDALPYVTLGPVTATDSAYFSETLSDYEFYFRMSPPGYQGNPQIDSCLSKYEDDTYTLWLEMATDTFPLRLSGGGYLSTGGGSVTLSNYIDLPILSGNCRVYGCFQESTGYSSVTLNSITVALSYFVYD